MRISIIFHLILSARLLSRKMGEVLLKEKENLFDLAITKSIVLKCIFSSFRRTIERKSIKFPDDFVVKVFSMVILFDRSPKE